MINPVQPDPQPIQDPLLPSAPAAPGSPPQLELELGIPPTLRTEFNFLKFPFFDLAKDSQRSRIKLEEWIETPEGTGHLLWLVTRDIEGQFPGDFEKRLHRAIEQILNTLPKPIVNPIRIGSFRSLAELMGIHPDSGKNYQDIQRAFKNIIKTSIETEGTFQLKETTTKRYIKDTFHLYDRVVFKGELLPDGDVATGVYLMLGSWYLHNINHHYVVPLDWRFYTQLKGSITTRMYEFLSIHFFTALERGHRYHDVRYSQLCAYFPMVRQLPRWRAQKQLKHAHDSLTQAGYLTHVDWSALTDPTDWLLRYWIGPKAQAEYHQNKTELRQLGPPLKPVFLPERRRRRSPSAPVTPPPGDSPLLAALIRRGLAQRVARHLVQTQANDWITQKVAVFDWLIETKSELVAKNPAGFLRKSIEDRYADPVGFVSQEEREAQRRQQARRIEGHRSEEDESKQHWRRQAAIQREQMTPEERQMLRAQAETRIPELTKQVVDTQSAAYAKMLDAHELDILTEQQRTQVSP